MPEPAFQQGKRIVVDAQQEQETQGRVALTAATCSATGVMALGVGSCLTLIDGKSANIELEFEHEIIALCWDPKGTCLIVGDATNCLHFINKDAALLFSYSNLPKSSEANILSISFLDGQPSSLLIAFDNGLVVEIPKVPLSSIPETYKARPQMVIGAISNLSHNKCAFSGDGVQKAIFFSVQNEEDKENVRNEIHAVVLDGHKILVHYPLGRQGNINLNPNESRELLSGKHSIDMAIISGDVALSVVLSQPVNGSPNLHIIALMDSHKETYRADISVEPDFDQILSVHLSEVIENLRFMHISLKKKGDCSVFTYCVIFNLSFSETAYSTCLLLNKFMASSTHSVLVPVYEKSSGQFLASSFFSQSRSNDKEILSRFSLCQSVPSSAIEIAAGFNNDDRDHTSGLLYIVGSLLGGSFGFDAIQFAMEALNMPLAIEPFLCMALYFGCEMTATHISLLFTLAKDLLQTFYDSSGDIKHLNSLENLRLGEYCFSTCLQLTDWMPQSLVSQRSSLQNRFYELTHGNSTFCKRF